MKFLIVRASDIMSIDNVVASVDCSSLSANVSLVLWDGSLGQVEYNDRPALREAFTDPSPYFGLLNLWLTSEAAATPALTAAQARAIKGGFVDSLYGTKRTAPISFSGSSWDVSDESLAAMVASLVSASSTGVNAAFAALIVDINTHVVAPTAAMITALNADVGTLNSATLTGLLNAIDSAAGGSNPPPTYNPSNLLGAYGAPTNVASESVGGSVAWLPAGATVAVTVDLAGLVAAIVARRNTLAVTRATKKAALAALSTVAAVVGYDITAGW